MSEDAQPPTNDSFSKREKIYTAAIAALAVAFVVSMAYNLLMPKPALSFQAPEGQQEQLVDFNPDHYTKEELANKVKSGQARVAEAYALEFYYCNSQDLGGNFAYAVANTSLEGMVITTDIDCHLQDGKVKSYSITFDREGSQLMVQEKQGPNFPA